MKAVFSNLELIEHKATGLALLDKTAKEVDDEIYVLLKGGIKIGNKTKVIY